MAANDDGDYGPEITRDDNAPLDDADDAEDTEDVEGGEPEGGQAARPSGSVTVKVPQPTRPGGSPTRPSKWVSRRDFDTLRESHSRLESMISQLGGRIEGFMSRPPAQGGQGGQGGGQAQSTQEEQQLSAINTALQSIIDQSANPELTAEQRQQLGQQFQRLEGQRQSLREEILMGKLLERIRPAIEGSRQDPQVAAAQSVIAQEFPEVFESAGARKLARSYYESRIEAGAKDGIDLVRESAAFARRSLGLGRSSGPSQRDRAASGGVPGGGGPRSNGERTFSAQEMKIIAPAGVRPEDVAAYEADLAAGKFD